MKSQFVTSSWGGRRKLPYVFSEHGVLMLSSVLKSSRAIDVNIQIMRIFTQLRNMIQENAAMRQDIDHIKSKLKSNDEDMGIIFGYLDKLLDKDGDDNKRKHVGYKSFEG